MNMQRKRTVLAVDDDEINLMILVKNIQDSGYAVKSFSSGEAAWEYLEAHPQSIDIALLDKMMPGMSGLDLLDRIKRNDALKYMPVIIQSGDVGVAQMREGLNKGAYYYLTKPFHPEILTAILHSVNHECDVRVELFQQMQEGQAHFVGMLQEGEFIIRNHDDARAFAAAVSHASVYPEFTALGLMELLVNSIEHGNLDIGYECKRRCLMDGTWQEELSARMASDTYATRVVRVHIGKADNTLHIAITDEGRGFDWYRYIYDDDASLRLNEPNGRGIAKAMIMLDDVRYIDAGNKVYCSVNLVSAHYMPQPYTQPSAVRLHS